MNRYLSTAASLSLGFSCACFMDVLVLLLSPRHDVVLHLIGPASALFVPALLNIVALALLCFLVLFSLRNFLRLRRLAVAALSALLPWILTKNSCYLLDIPLNHRASMSLFLACLALFLLLVFFPRSAANPRLLAARSALHVVYFGLAAVGLLFCVEALFFGIEARHLNRLPPIQPAMAQRPGNGHGRVLWVVLDELGYQQIYGNRLPGLRLPNFDTLRDQSTVFSDVQPAGIYTEIVLPDLMTGIPASEIHTSSNGRRLTFELGRRNLPFQASDTVFADSNRLGYRNAVIGWYVPYCRLLQGVLSSCFWTGQTDLSDLYPAHTILPNLIHPLVRLLHKIPFFFVVTDKPTPDEVEEGRLHFADYTAIDQATQQVLDDPRNDFILLHAPVPHPEGVWNGQTQTFDVNRSNYVDNLVLADDYLGQIITSLQQHGEWDSTTVVLMGDHAWRTQLLWIHSRSWKHIDQVASDGGRFDPRPGYVVKLPNQHTPATIATPFAAIHTRALLDQLLRHTITTPAELQQFVLAQPPEPSSPPSKGGPRIHPRS